MIKGLPLTIIFTIIVLAFFVMDYYFMFRYDSERQKGKGWSWDYTLLTIALGLAIILQPVLWPNLAWSVDSLWGLAIQAVGSLSVSVSFLLHIWSRQHLRQFYAERVEVQAKHRLIDTGPYAFVRHPIITSFFLLSGGLTIMNPGVVTGLVFIYTIWDFTRAAKQEENLLSNTVPGYTAYMKRTPRFLPSLWRNQ